jgi:hypothetical protein
MNILYWTVRGIGNSDARLTLKYFYLSHKPSLIFIAEPTINFHQVPAWYCPSISVSKYCINNRGSLLPNLWALWGNDLLATVIFISDQGIAFFLANLGHSVVGTVWQNSLPHALALDFFRDRCGLPNYRFP